MERMKKSLFAASAALALSLAASPALALDVPEADPAGNPTPDKIHWQDYGDGTLAGARWYAYLNGALVRSDWVESGGNWYFVDENADMLVGKQRLTFLGKQGFYFFNPLHDGTYGKMRTGWFEWKAEDGGDGAWYYLEPKAGTGKQGEVTVGWRQIGGTYYWFDAEGRMATGEVEVDGKTQRFDAGGAWVGEVGSSEAPAGDDSGKTVSTETPGWRRDSRGWRYAVRVQEGRFDPYSGSVEGADGTRYAVGPWQIGNPQGQIGETGVYEGLFLFDSEGYLIQNALVYWFGFDGSDLGISVVYPDAQGVLGIGPMADAVRAGGDGIGMVSYATATGEAAWGTWRLKTDDGSERGVTKERTYHFGWDFEMLSVPRPYILTSRDRNARYEITYGTVNEFGEING